MQIMSDDAGLPWHEFDLRVGLDDPRPSPHWVPCPEQIRSFAAEIRSGKGHQPSGIVRDDESVVPHSIAHTHRRRRSASGTPDPASPFASPFSPFANGLTLKIFEPRKHWVLGFFAALRTDFSGEKRTVATFIANRVFLNGVRHTRHERNAT